MKLTLVLESLRTNQERRDVSRWVLSVIDEGDFEIEKEGAMFEFITKIKEKFKASCWKKCRDTWDQIQ